MEIFSAMNLVDAVIDEVALEGLDGITLEALWSRMAMRFGQKGPLTRELMQQIWDICLQVDEFSFHELEKERQKLIIYDRYEFIDPDLGIILESDNVPDDIYTHCPIDDWKNGIIGSCASYHTRREISDIAKTLNVHEAEEKYGRKLVIVASQSVRKNALMDKTVCPTLDMTVMQYCFLERVGRSRYHGEVTQGKLSLSLLGEDPRSLFYHRKFLLRHKLVTKQTHHQKNGRYGCTGSLLHLPRFYVERKPKVIFLAERVIEILKSRENQVAEYTEIKKELMIENSIKKLFKTSFFQKVVKTDLIVPWRTLYPHATDAEWQCKRNSSKEKMLRVVQLLEPNLDINDLWKDDIVDDDETFELDTSEQKYGVPFMKQANEYVEASKQEGLGQSDLMKKMGLTRLHARSIFRYLVKCNIVAVYMNDVGRQRVSKYVSRKFESSSRMSKQFNREMTKMKKLTEDAVRKSNESVEEDIPEATPMICDSDPDEPDPTNDVVMSDENNEIENTPPESDPKAFVRTNSLNAAAKILRKYKLKGAMKNYKRTFRDLGKSTAGEDENRPAKRRKLSVDGKGKNSSRSRAKSSTPTDDPIPISIGELEEKLQILDPPASINRGNDVVGLKSWLEHDVKNVSNVTYRLLKRANTIIEAVKEHKVIDDLSKLVKAISEEEEKEGYDVKIDKKSLIRLLQRLAKDGLVKNIKLTLTTSNREKNLTFICDPSIDVNHTVIRSAVEQTKIKFCLVGPQKETQKVKTVLQTGEEKVELSSENPEDLKSMGKLDGNGKKKEKSLLSTLTYDRKAGRRFGYTPKFIRMQVLHAYLFYIAYEHPGKARETNKTLIEVLRNKGITIDDNLADSITQIYNTEIGWKTFVPPLPKHNGWPTGWVLMCDILLRMPLSVFLKIHKLSYLAPGLEEYTNHPIKKHLLVKDIPASIRNILLIRRKYIFSVHDTVSRLCYLGLLQFGPQKFKEKDKVFIYINRKTQLLDTTTSAAHYHKIEMKEYPVMRFDFNSLQVVDKYWYKFWMTCINTRLGGRLVVQGKDIVLEDLAKKSEMIEATKARSPEMAAIMDDYHVPGDRMGAAGMDSALFAHLKRNWNWENSNYPFGRFNADFERERDRFEPERDTHLSRVKEKPVKFTEFPGLKRTSGPTVVDAIDLRKWQARNQTPNNAGATVWKMKNNRLMTLKTGTGKQRSYVRRVLPRRCPVRARVKYDEIDHNALQRMEKLRVDWNTKEDNILLVCKVAMTYLCPNHRRQLIGFTAVRDVLRLFSPVSCNKTSRACQRRLAYMLKKPETRHSVSLGVEELKEDFNTNRRFADMVEKLKKELTRSHRYDEQVHLVFRDLVMHIAKKHHNIADDIEASKLDTEPTTIEEFRLLHRIKYPKKLSNLHDRFHENTINDIHSSTINSVIHSSMCCVKDRRSWAYQLFRIYQQYPEWLLRNVMAKIRTDQMISIKKHYVFAMRKQPNTCMPMSSSQYQLSSGYVQKFNTKWPYSVFKEAWEFFYQLAKHHVDNFLHPGNCQDKQKIGMETTTVNGGTVAAIHDYININRMDFDLEIPRQVIMFDPSLPKDDERFARIAQRYQDVMTNLQHFSINEHEPGNSEIPVEKVAENREESSEVVKKIALSSAELKDFPASSYIDNEPVESVDAMTFDKDDCFDEASPDDEFEDDDLICFLDGTKIRLTSEDIENCGFSAPKTKKNRGEEIEKRASMQEGSSGDVLNEASRNEKDEVFPMDIEESDEDFADIEEIIENLEENEFPKDSNSSAEYWRVNDQIKRAKFQKFVNYETQGVPRFNSEANDVQKRITRLALLQMREELNDLAVSESHHAHDFFVLNKFKIFCILQRHSMQTDPEFATMQGLKVPVNLLLADRHACTSLVAGLRKFSTFPKTPLSYERFRKNLQKSPTFKRALDAVYEFIHDKSELGANLLELSTKFYSILGDELYSILSVLKDGRLVLRSGINDTRYIHQKYADPWLIHSYKIMRLHKESLANVPSGSLYVAGEERNNETNGRVNGAATSKNIAEGTKNRGGEDSKEDSREIHEDREMNRFKRSDKAKELNESRESNDNAEKCEAAEKNEENAKNEAANDSEAGPSNQRKIQRNRTCLLPTKDIYRAAKQLDLDTAEEIRVVVRPWIRIDGAPNRRVLDRMLGGILAYCLQHPGVYLTKIQEKFSPALQPFHTKELVEMLMKLECLKMGVAKKTRVTLFSKSSSKRPEYRSCPEGPEWSDEELVVEPVLGATLKFGMFLSNRPYTTDYLA